MNPFINRCKIRINWIKLRHIVGVFLTENWLQRVLLNEQQNELMLWYVWDLWVFSAFTARMIHNNLLITAVDKHETANVTANYENSSAAGTCFECVHVVLSFRRRKIALHGNNSSSLLPLKAAKLINLLIAWWLERL